MTHQEVGAIVNELVRAGYMNLDVPLSIASVPFEFDALLVGPKGSLDLIIVIDLDREHPKRAQQKAQALGQALDVAASRRSVSFILCGALPEPQTLERLSDVGRVLLTGATGSGRIEVLREDLAVLLPLEVPVLTNASTDPIEELTAILDSKTKRQLSSSDLVWASVRGEREVREYYKDWLRTAINKDVDAQ